MPSHKITIVTSPPATNTSLPGCLSPTTKGPVQYRIEERSRTIYVTSDLHPSQLEHSFDQIFSIAELAEGTTQIDHRHTSEIQALKLENSVDPPELRSHTPRNNHRKSRRFEAMTASNQIQNSSDSPPISRKESPLTPTRSRILFYHKHDPYYGFTNFSDHPVIYKGKKYPTSEHLFQSFKFQKHRPNLAEHIRTCSERPAVAFSEARRFEPEVRRDWKTVNIPMMDEALWHKFTQHLDLKAQLLATGDAELVEDSDKDAFWGVGPDGRGRNELGKALERLREKLRDA